MAKTSTKNKINSCMSKGELRHLIAETIQEVLADPDFGLELNPDFVKRLRESTEQKKEGKVVPLEDILKKHNKK
jgi:hypothetical protein